VMPKSSVEMMEFLQQHYSEEQLTGVFQPVWHRLAKRKPSEDSKEPPPSTTKPSEDTTVADTGHQSAQRLALLGHSGGAAWVATGATPAGLMDEYLKDCALVPPMRLLDTRDMSTAVTSTVRSILDDKVGGMQMELHTLRMDLRSLMPMCEELKKCLTEVIDTKLDRLLSMAEVRLQGMQVCVYVCACEELGALYVFE
jgi:hypothetical protein